MLKEILEDLEEYSLAAIAVGSRVTCTPPPTDTDQDILVLVERYKGYPHDNPLEDLEEFLTADQWKFEGEKYGEMKGEFESWRKDEFNIIVTQDEKWFDTFLDATASCKAKNLMTKEERVAEFNTFFKKKDEQSAADAAIARMKYQEQLAAMQAQQNAWNVPNYLMQANAVQSVMVFDDIVTIGGKVVW